jgi:hypothetical protein
VSDPVEEEDLVGGSDPLNMEDIPKSQGIREYYEKQSAGQDKPYTAGILLQDEEGDIVLEEDQEA